VSGVSTDAQGNVLIENGNHTAAMKLGGGIFGIANTRNEDGTYNWQTFGDGNGFTAQYLNAGILQGGKVKWNLDNTTLDGLPPGALRIGDSALSYVLYFDGTTLRLGGNVVIDWDTVISPDATQVGAIPGTMIDANNVFTGNVYATNVKGGQISGCLFKTAPATQTASYIKIYETYIDFVDSTGTSVFKMGTGFPEAQAGKPQLFLGEGCSVDVYQGSLRLRANDGQLNTSNYIRINKAVLDASGNYVSGGGVDYVIGNNVYPIIGGDGSGGTTGTPVFG
jgi:hypothetical protein